MQAATEGRERVCSMSEHVNKVETELSALCIMTSTNAFRPKSLLQHTSYTDIQKHIFILDYSFTN